MSNLDYKKKFSIVSIVAVVLAVFFIVSVVLGCGTYFGGWFSKVKTVAGEEESDFSMDNVSVDTSVSTGKLSLISSRNTALTASSSVEYLEGSTVTLTAVYNTNATNPTFTWSTKNSTETITGGIVVYIATSVSTDTTSCTVTFNNIAFSKQITVTCTADDDPTVYATCTIDYVKRATDASFVINNSYGTNFTWSSSGTSYDWSIPNDDWNDNCSGLSSIYYTSYISTGAYSVTGGTGTLTETYSLKYVAMNSWADQSDFGSYLYYPDYPNLDNDDCIRYNQLFGWAVSDISSSSYRTKYYNTLNKYYTAGTGITFRLVLVGDITGLEYSFDYKLMCNPELLYEAVTSVSLEQSSIAF